MARRTTYRGPHRRNAVWWMAMVSGRRHAALAFAFFEKKCLRSWIRNRYWFSRRSSLSTFRLFHSFRRVKLQRERRKLAEGGREYSHTRWKIIDTLNFANNPALVKNRATIRLASFQSVKHLLCQLRVLFSPQRMFLRHVAGKNARIFLRCRRL